jgi:site-specific recombinase XerD
MNQTAQIIQFPGTLPTKEKAKERKIRNIDGIKYLTEPQAKALRRMVRDQAATRKMTSIREWMAVDLLISSGLRVSEAANLRCGDIKTHYGESAVFVRCGKGAKSRTVEIPDSLKKHLRSFLIWKENQGEATGPDDPLFIGQRGPWASSAIQQITKKYLRVLGIYEPGKSAHSLRHSYAVAYYRESGHDLRGLQKQLGHSSIQTTGQIYVDVSREDIQHSIKNLWN